MTELYIKVASKLGHPPCFEGSRGCQTSSWHVACPLWWWFGLRGNTMTCALCLRRLSFIVLTAAARAVVGRQHPSSNAFNDGLLLVRQV